MSHRTKIVVMPVKLQLFRPFEDDEEKLAGVTMPSEKECLEALKAGPCLSSEELKDLQQVFGFKVFLYEDRKFIARKFGSGITSWLQWTGSEWSEIPEVGVPKLVLEREKKERTK
jgi:hypothetical protein